MNKVEITVISFAVITTLFIIFNFRYNTLFIPESVLDKKCKEPVAFAGIVTLKYPSKQRPYITVIEGKQYTGGAFSFSTVDKKEIALVEVGDSVVKEKANLTYSLFKSGITYSFRFTSNSGCSLFVFD